MENIFGCKVCLEVRKLWGLTLCSACKGQLHFACAVYLKERRLRRGSVTRRLCPDCAEID